VLNDEAARDEAQVMLPKSMQNLRLGECPISEEEEKSISDEEAVVSHDVDGMWDDDPVATWQAETSSSPKVQSVDSASIPPRPPKERTADPKPPPKAPKSEAQPPPPKERAVVPKSPPKAPTIEETPSAKPKPPAAKPPPPMKEVAPSGKAKQPPAPAKESFGLIAEDSDSDEDEEQGASAKRKKKKKKKKNKEVAKQSEDQADAQVEDIAPPPTIREAPRSKLEEKEMQQLHSKTAFSGMAGDSDSEAEAPLQPKEKTSSAKARLVEKKKDKVVVADGYSDDVDELIALYGGADLPAMKEAPRTLPKGKQKAMAKLAPNVGFMVKPPPPGVSAKPAPAGVSPPERSEAIPKVRPSPPPAPPGRFPAESKQPPPRPAPPPVPSSSSSAQPRPPYERDAELAKELQDELNRDEDFFAGLTRLPGKTTPSALQGASPKAKAAAAKTAAKPKPLAAKAPQVKGLNPLPQRAAVPAPKTTVYVENSATGLKWAERPVEKIVPGAAYYEEEEDPELACYLWDRKAQRPKKEQARPSAPPSMESAPPLSAARVSAPAPQRQRVLLSKVMEMGFDEQRARRALTETGWAGVEEALMRLLG